MMRSRRLFVLGVSGLLVGCGAHVRPVTPPPAASYSLPVQPFTGIPSAPVVSLSVDPTTAAIARAEGELTAGETELSLGRQASAREHFDAAVDALLAVPGGARSDARLEAAFDRLIDRIS